MEYIHKAVGSSLIISAIVGRWLNFPTCFLKYKRVRFRSWSAGDTRTQHIFTILTTYLHQAFYALRIQKLSKRWSITLVCWFLSCLRAISLLATCVAALMNPFIPEFVEKWDWLVFLSIGISTSADIIIAVSLCYLLWQRRGTAIKRYVCTCNFIL